MLQYIIRDLPLNEGLDIKYLCNRTLVDMKCGQKPVVRCESNFGKLHRKNLFQTEPSYLTSLLLHRTARYFG